MSNYNITSLRFWCQKVLPLVYDDSLSYYELLCKVTNKINELIENNNELPDYIKNEIFLQLQDKNLEQIVSYLLTDLMINVKFPPEGIEPAKGDGITDDTLTFQSCINYANENGGKTIFIPNGTYYVSSITLLNNVSLLGASNFSTILRLKTNNDSHLLKGTTQFNNINNLCLDGNISNQINNLSCISFNGTNFNFNNLVLRNSNIGIDIINTTGTISLENIEFQNTITGIKTRGNNIIISNNLRFFHNIQNTPSYIINNTLSNSSFSNIYSNINTETAILNTGNNCTFEGNIFNSGTPISNNSTNTSYYFNGFKAERTDRRVNYILNKEGKYGTVVNSYTNSLTEIANVKNETITSLNENVKNRVINGDASIETLTGNKTQNSVVNTENVTSKIINATDINLNTSNPLTYKTPGSLNKYFKYVPFKGQNGTEYSVLVSNDYDFSLKPKRKAIYIGDSYFNGVGATPTTDLVYYINKKCGIAQHWNYSHGATGFIRNTDSLKFYNQLVQASNDSQITDKTEVTDIIVAGGLNDTGASWTQALLNTECNNISTLAKTAFPNAKLWYVPFMWINIPYSYDYHRLYIAINKACLKSGDATLSGAPSWLYRLDSTYQNGDDIHPSEKGYELMSNYICNFLNGGYQGVNEMELVTSTVGEVDYSICCEIVNSIVYLKGNFNVKTTIPAITNMGNLPSRAIPQSLTVLPCIYYNTGNKTNSPLYIQANDSKITTINSLTAGAYHVTTSYPLYPFIGV